MLYTASGDMGPLILNFDNDIYYILYNYVFFLTVDRFLHIIIVNVFLFVAPCRWPHECPKHVGGYRVIKLHSYTQVHLLVFSKVLYIF
jgi:hypothetical protein